MPYNNICMKKEQIHSLGCGKCILPMNRSPLGSKEAPLLGPKGINGQKVVPMQSLLPQSGTQVSPLMPAKWALEP